MSTGKYCARTAGWKKEESKQTEQIDFLIICSIWEWILNVAYYVIWWHTQDGKRSLIKLSLIKTFSCVYVCLFCRMSRNRFSVIAQKMNIKLLLSTTCISNVCVCVCMFKQWINKTTNKCDAAACLARLSHTCSFPPSYNVLIMNSDVRTRWGAFFWFILCHDFRLAFCAGIIFAMLRSRFRNLFLDDLILTVEKNLNF